MSSARKGGDPKDPQNIVLYDKELIKWELDDISAAIAYRNLFSLVSGLYGIVFKVCNLEHEMLMSLSRGYTRKHVKKPRLLRDQGYGCVNSCA